MSHSDPAETRPVAAGTSLEEFVATIEAGALHDVPGEVLQKVMAGAVRAYAARLDAGVKLRAFPPQDGVTATEIMLVSTALLKAANLQLFEMAMWQASSGHF